MANVFKLNTFNVLLFTYFVYGLPDPDDPVPDKVRRHFTGKERDPNYYHEAFIGQEAEEFDNTTQEESRKRLGLIVNKIDKNNDGFVTEDELKNWITFIGKRSTMNFVEEFFNIYKKSADDKISWPEYYPEYNIVDSFTSGANDVQKQDCPYTKLVSRDKRRWAAADVDGDGLLTKDEFFSFCDDGIGDNAIDSFVINFMDGMDKDKDGKISIYEYTEYLHADWGKNEEISSSAMNVKKHFEMFRDKDGDGFLDTGEVKDWILPPFNYEKSLIYKLDSDWDGKLTKNEILEKYDLFVESLATDYGDAIEKEYFQTYIDKDGNEFLDIGKIKDLDLAEVESRHSIYESNSDADRKLTKNEILEKNVFVGSPATINGEAFIKRKEL